MQKNHLKNFFLNCKTGLAISLHAMFLINLELKIKKYYLYILPITSFLISKSISYVLNSEKDYFAAYRKKTMEITRASVFWHIWSN